MKCGGCCCSCSADIGMLLWILFHKWCGCVVLEWHLASDLDFELKKVSELIKYNHKQKPW